MGNFKGLLLQSFNPRSLSPMLMIDADNLLGTGTANNPANGASVTSWVDLSGNSNTFTTGTAPAYATNAMNGHNVVTFNGTTQFLTCANNASNSYSANTNVTIFAIASHSGTATLNEQLITKGNGGVGGWGMGLQGGAANQMEITQFTVAGQESLTNSWGTSSSTYSLMTCLYTNGVGSTIYKNAANADVIAGTGGCLAYTSAMLLGKYLGGPYFWSGNVNFIWVKYGLLTAAQLALMHGWCKARMGI